MSNKSKYKRAEATCKFCKTKYWAHTQARLDAWMAHHTVTECPIAAKVVKRAVEVRESGASGSLSLESLISDAQAEALRDGTLTPDGLSEAVARETDAKKH